MSDNPQMSVAMQRLVDCRSCRGWCRYRWWYQIRSCWQCLVWRETCEKSYSLSWSDDRVSESSDPWSWDDSARL
jgi:hypothetical protein